MPRLEDATIFPTLKDDKIVSWNIDGRVDLGDGTEQSFSWSTDTKPQLGELLDLLSVEFSRMVLEEHTE